MSDGIAIVSGGLDSTVMLYKLLKEGRHPDVVSFDYDQKHVVELGFAYKTCQRLGLRHDVVNLMDLSKHLTSALTQETVAVPEGRYDEENMKSTVVPNRNMIMLSIAAGIAISCRYSYIGYAAHAGDHAIYPDCRPEFVTQLSKTLHVANEDFIKPDFHIKAPFLQYSKADIVRLGKHLDVPFEATYSCYNGKQVHCGRCGTCVERREAFHIAGIPDPTEYVDAAYWRTVTVSED